MKGRSGRPRSTHRGIAWRRLTKRVGGTVKCVSASMSRCGEEMVRFCLTDDGKLDGQSENPQPGQLGPVEEFMRRHGGLMDFVSFTL